MAEPHGHTLLTRMLGVANEAIDAHRAESPWRQLVERTATRASPVFLVAIFENDPGTPPVERRAIRVHEGRLEVVDEPAGPAVDWRVSVAFLRDVAGHPDRYIEDPEKLELGWLARRLGLRA